MEQQMIGPDKLPAMLPVGDKQLHIELCMPLSYMQDNIEKGKPPTAQRGESCETHSVVHADARRSIDRTRMHGAFGVQVRVLAGSVLYIHIRVGYPTYRFLGRVRDLADDKP